MYDLRAHSYLRLDCDDTESSVNTPLVLLTWWAHILKICMIDLWFAKIMMLIIFDWIMRICSQHWPNFLTFLLDILRLDKLIWHCVFPYRINLLNSIGHFDRYCCSMRCGPSIEMDWKDKHDLIHHTERGVYYTYVSVWLFINQNGANNQRPRYRSYRQCLCQYSAHISFPFSWCPCEWNGTAMKYEYWQAMSTTGQYFCSSVVLLLLQQWNIQVSRSPRLGHSHISK